MLGEAPLSGKPRELSLGDSGHIAEDTDEGQLLICDLKSTSCKDSLTSQIANPELYRDLWVWSYFRASKGGGTKISTHTIQISSQDSL